MALCCLLAFWTGGDAARVDRLFRQSGLVREKLDEVHYTDGRTYGEATIQRALRVTSERYEPSAGTGDADGGRPVAGQADGPGTACLRERGAPRGATEAGDASVSGEDELAAPVPPESGDHASVAHLREENTVLRERLREQRARIETLKPQVTREWTGNSPSDGADEPQLKPSGSVFQRLRTLLYERSTGSDDES